MRLQLIQWDADADTPLEMNKPGQVNFDSGLQPGNAMPSANPTFVDLGKEYPKLAGKTLDGGYLTFYFVLRKDVGDLDGEIEIIRDMLNKWFRTDDFVFRKLLAMDLDTPDGDSFKKWYVEGYPITPPVVSDAGPAQYKVTLALKQPYWIENDLQEETWTITGDTDTDNLTNAGNMEALPVFEITPKEPKSSNGIAHKDFYPVHTSGYGASKLPFDITDGGLDTAALVGGGDMLASGNDVGVNVNGIYVPRWVGVGWNNVATKIWVNLNFTPAPRMVLATALAGSGVPATLVVTYLDAVVVTLAQNSTLQIEGELITYSSYTVDTVNKKITFIPVDRNAKGSTIDSHSIGVDVFWIENEIWLTYGNPSASAPVFSDAEKPPLDLDASTNDSWVLDHSFGDLTNLKAGSPALNGTAGPAQRGYTGTHDTEDDPYSVIGLYYASINGVNVRNNTFKMYWVFYHPGGFEHFLTHGEKYRFGESWPLIADIANGNPSKPGRTVYAAIGSPASAETWDDIDIDVDIPDHSQTIFFGVMNGLGTTLPLPYALMELQTATLSIYDPPVVTRMGAEQENYKLGGFLENQTNGHKILFRDLITKTNIKITIDCANQEIYSEDGKRLRGMIGFDGPKRDDWMTFQDGANVLGFSDTGTVELDIVRKWRGRNSL